MSGVDGETGLLALPGVEPARPDPTDGVAQVVLDVPLAHLDRTFDYAVPAALSAEAVPGARVAVRFAGREHQGFVVARRDRSDHVGTLAPLRRVVSSLPVLTPEVLALARAVADRYAGTLSDVLRLAVPPRHATTEKSVLARAGDGGPVVEGSDAAPADDAGRRPAEPGAGRWTEPWAAYQGGAAFIRRLEAGHAPRAVWTALPGTGADSWPVAVAAAAAATLAGGRGVVVVAPDARDVARLTDALTDARLDYVRLLADDGPAARYRSFVRALLGEARIVVGTRAAAFAPVHDLGLVVCWDDGDDLLAEPRAPYPHARQVLVTRAEQAGAGALLGAFARSTAAQALLEDGWARAVQAARPTVRARTPRVSAPGEVDLAREGPAAAARIPHPAWALAREALTAGPVLVQVPRAGYVPVTACTTCRRPARCAHCHGPLRVGRAGAPPTCAWCARPVADWVCEDCSGRALRAVRIGSERTAEELGRAFPGVPVTLSGTSAAQGVVTVVDAAPRLVVATPGAEPQAAGGYRAALLLDAAVTSGRPELWAAEEALRRWLGAAALVRPSTEGGHVMLLGQGAPIPVQALVRWDPGGFAERELAERSALDFPPAVRMASVQGPPDAVASFLGHLALPTGAEVLGPVPVPAERPAPGTATPGTGAVRALVRIGRGRSSELTGALAGAAAARSARKEPGSVRVQVDPGILW